MMATPAAVLRSWVMAQAGDAGEWITEQLEHLAQTQRERDLHMFLGLAPRRLGKADLRICGSDFETMEGGYREWLLAGWSIDSAARVLGLVAFRGCRPFAETFKDLRRTADAAELIALYRGLPLYPDPGAMDFEVGEGLRSNLRPVFEAIAHNNPFPRDHFAQHRWNHMILKALFVGSQLAPIVGLQDRANPELARILLDYAEERWAAGRSVSDELWIPVRPFMDRFENRTSIGRALKEGKLAEELLTCRPSTEQG